MCDATDEEYYKAEATTSNITTEATAEKTDVTYIEPKTTLTGT